MAISKDRSFEVEHGLDVYDPNSGNQIQGPFFTGGPSVPVGLNLPTDTVYVQNKSDGLIMWRKFGGGVNDWAVHDGLYRRDLVEYDIFIPERNSMQMHSTSFDGELVINGEGYVL